MHVPPCPQHPQVAVQSEQAHVITDMNSPLLFVCMALETAPIPRSEKREVESTVGFRSVSGYIGGFQASDICRQKAVPPTAHLSKHPASCCSIIHTTAINLHAACFQTGAPGTSVAHRLMGPGARPRLCNAACVLHVCLQHTGMQTLILTLAALLLQQDALCRAMSCTGVPCHHPLATAAKKARLKSEGCFACRFSSLHCSCWGLKTSTVSRWVLISFASPPMAKIWQQHTVHQHSTAQQNLMRNDPGIHNFFRACL